ncbi:MAG: radical SAM family heme chaperone HemW [bacterium]|nr:radical SAM family heme chaperone HemW [bacterium]
MTYGVYIHVPLCRRRCAYCDFTSYVATPEAGGRVVAGLLRELELGPPIRRKPSEPSEASYAPGEPSYAPGKTLYVGGGTPNILGADDLGNLIARTRDRFRIHSGAEVSTESNPCANSGIGYFEALLRAGLTRLSVGFQSFDEDELRMLGRLHRSTDTGIFANARRAGVRSVSIDLMYGLPGQGPKAFQKSLEAALSLGVDHMSLYALKLEPSTPLGRAVERGELPTPDPDAAADMYYAALDRLESEGLAQYELSNFARPGHRCRHNEIYWEAGPFVGFGPSAVSDDGEVRRRNTPDLEAWLGAVEKGRPPDGEDERPTERERRLEMAMLALRTRDGLSGKRFRGRWGVEVEQAFPALAGHLAAGRLELLRGSNTDDVRWRIAREHQLIADRILVDLVGETSVDRGMG